MYAKKVEMVHTSSVNNFINRKTELSNTKQQTIDLKTPGKFKKSSYINPHLAFKKE